MTDRYVAIADLPARAAREETHAGPPRLPALERLLARGHVRAASPDWRRWALANAGLEAPAGDLPLGRLLARAAGLGVEPSDSWLVAAPVRLEAGMSSVTVGDGAGALGTEAAAALARGFTAEWGDSCELHAHGEVLLYRERAPLEVETVDPEALSDADLKECLPRGRDGPALTRRMTEIQMWLHARNAGCNGLWLWGGGRGELTGTPTWPALATADAPLAAARRLHPGRAATPAAELEYVSRAAFGADGFAAADAKWFEPLEAALRGGQAARVELHVGAHAIALDGRRVRHWWRRPRPWWEFGT